jgi:hypothetical protein
MKETYCTVYPFVEIIKFSCRCTTVLEKFLLGLLAQTESPDFILKIPRTLFGREYPKILQQNLKVHKERENFPGKRNYKLILQ